MRKFAVTIVLICLASALHAQERGRGAGFVRLNVEAGTIKGAPYSADVINETVQTLSDGNRIVRRSTSRMYRDNEGRTRREEDRPSGVPGSPAIFISDPAAGMSWTLNTDTRVARQTAALQKAYGATIQLDNLQVLLNGVPTFVARGGRGGFVQAGEPHAEERLTPKTIEGVRVEGVRRTTTIAAGTIGNERPIVVTSDEWTSPELKIVVLSESNDPRTGTSTYKVVNLKRGDPPAPLFQVPGDYQVLPALAVGGRGVGDGRGGRGGAPQPSPR